MTGLIWCNDCKKQKPPHPNKPRGSWCEECLNRRINAVTTACANPESFTDIQKQFRREKRQARESR